MKKLLPGLLCLLLTTSTVVGQEDFEPSAKLFTTAKIWGFLKYYHPQVNQGKFNWDDQLMEILPEVKKARDKEDLSKVYLRWIDSLGEIPECLSCEESDSTHFDRNFDLSWTQNRNFFTAELQQKLKFIEHNRSVDSLYYASASPSVGNIQIRNEPEYDDFEYPSEPYRLLSLFKFWNIVEYFYPYKYAMDEDWDDVLKEMIPKIRNAGNATEFHLTIRELVMKIDDGHARYTSDQVDSYFGPYWTPVYYNRIDQKWVITGFYNDSLAKLNDLRVGDIVEKVDGEPIEDIFEKNRKYIPGSNEISKYRNSYFALTNGTSDSVILQIERAGKSVVKTVQRYLFNEFNYPSAPSDEKWKWLEDGIGYVNMGTLEKEDVPAMMDTLMQAEAIIFDIRNYPKGTMYSIAAFLNDEERDFVKFTMPDLSYPGKFKWRTSHGCGQENGQHYQGKVVLLVNEITQSHSEFTCMCLQTADDVTVIGSQTAGADGNISRFQLPGGYSTIMTGLGIYYPDGRETQRIGIVPDIEVRPGIEDIRNGKDRVLEKALVFLHSQKK